MTRGRRRATLAPVRRIALLVVLALAAPAAATEGPAPQLTDPCPGDRVDGDPAGAAPLPPARDLCSGTVELARDATVTVTLRLAAGREADDGYEVTARVGGCAHTITVAPPTAPGATIGGFFAQDCDGDGRLTDASVIDRDAVTADDGAVVLRLDAARLRPRTTGRPATWLLRDGVRVEALAARTYDVASLTDGPAPHVTLRLLDDAAGPAAPFVLRAPAPPT